MNTYDHHIIMLTRIPQTTEECSKNGKFKSDLFGDEITKYLKALKKNHLNPLSDDNDEDDD